MSFAIVGFVLIYPFLLLIALFITSRFTKTTKAKLIVFAVWSLIPTWDVIIGYPIYWYLCKYESGMKIYKTVDNVEGFYVGEKSKEYEPYEPYAGYRFIDYKEKVTGKYYHSYWIDSNTSNLCIPIGDDAWVGQGKLYSAAFKQGKCIVKEEIKVEEASRLWFDSDSMDRQTKLRIIPLLNFTHYIPLLIQDTTSSQKLGQLDYFWWNGGWLYGFISSIEVGSGGVGCGFIDNTPEITFVNTILKPKQGASNGNY